MKLHVFNPEHDTALAANILPFTAPHAARQLHHDLSFLPALWADKGDFVLVDDKATAHESLKRIGMPDKPVVFIEPGMASVLPDVHFDAVSVWGWDKAVKHSLLKMGFAESALPMPSDSQLDTWRTMSGRAWAAENILKPLVAENDSFVGCAKVATSLDEALYKTNMDMWVLKSPWSCSGRGVRYVASDTVTSHLEGWVSNAMARQGCIMVEPYYAKILDLAAEFFCDVRGKVHYLGLSLFETKNGAYVGNIIAPEQRKRNVVSQYIPLNVLDNAIAAIVKTAERAFDGRYEGHFGVDMMVVGDGDNGYRLHPCVELNLRKTMGFVSLCVNTSPYIPTKVMRIVMDKKYRLRIVDSEGDIWK